MEIGIDSIDIFLKWADSLKKEGNLYIAGAGTYGKILGRFLSDNGICWDGYIDRDTKILEVDGKKIYLYSKEILKEDYFIISSYIYTDEIIGELKRRGVLEDHIFVFINIQKLISEMYEKETNWSLYTKKVQRFHNRYVGKRCFIIGNGPSLRIVDLEKLQKEYTFACNSIYALYKSTSWRPTFYCASDSVFCKNMMSQKENVKMLTSTCRAAFTSIIKDGFQYRDDEEIQNLYYVFIRREFEPETKLPLFSDDCSKQIYDSGTVTYSMLQLAGYMGFKEIYLIGMDMSFSVERYKDGRVQINTTDNHIKMIEKEEEKFKEDLKAIHGYSYIADVDIQLDGYKAAKKYAEENDIKIYNATRGGKLEIFERVEYDTLF